MKRRLFLLLPDTGHAEQLGSDLQTVDIKSLDVHAVARGDVRLKGVNDVRRPEDRDTDQLLEWWLWRINLAIFFVAVLTFFAMLIWSPSYWLILPLVIMTGAFIGGFVYVLKMPQTHIDEFRPAIRHGEILMMVDTPASRLADVRRYIQRRHPEAIIGGVGWHA